MFSSTLFRSLALLSLALLFCILVASFATTQVVLRTVLVQPPIVAAQPATPVPPQVIAAHAFGRPIAAGRYIFWVDMRHWVDARNERATIYGYDLITQQEFMVKEVGSVTNALSLTSDGTTVAWIDHVYSDGFSRDRIQGYDLATRREFTIRELDIHDSFSSVALADGVVYYDLHTKSETGIYSSTLDATQVQQLSPQGYYVVAADGKVLWQEECYAYGPCRLYGLDLATGRRTEVVNGRAAFTGYAVAGDTIVWSFFYDTEHRGIGAYDMTAGVSTTISVDSGWFPIIDDSRVAWNTVTSQGAAITHTLTVLDRATGATQLLVAASNEHVRACALLPDGRVLFTVNSPGSSGHTLYLSQPGQAGLTFAFNHLPEVQGANPAQFFDSYVYVDGGNFKVDSPRDYLGGL